MIKNAKFDVAEAEYEPSSKSGFVEMAAKFVPAVRLGWKSIQMSDAELESVVVDLEEYAQTLLEEFAAARQFFAGYHEIIEAAETRLGDALARVEARMDRRGSIH